MRPEQRSHLSVAETFPTLGHFRSSSLDLNNVPPELPPVGLRGGRRDGMEERKLRSSCTVPTERIQSCPVVVGEVKSNSWSVAEAPSGEPGNVFPEL